MSKVTLFKTYLTVIECPKMTGWALVWDHGRLEPIWTTIHDSYSYPRRFGKQEA